MLDGGLIEAGDGDLGGEEDRGGASTFGDGSWTAIVCAGLCEGVWLLEELWVRAVGETAAGESVRLPAHRTERIDAGEGYWRERERESTQQSRDKGQGQGQTTNSREGTYEEEVEGCERRAPTARRSVGFFSSCRHILAQRAPESGHAALLQQKHAAASWASGAGGRGRRR